jgi:hypothetical protein
MIHELLVCFNFGPGTRSGFNKTKPGLANPLGTRLAPLGTTDLWIQNPTQTRLLMEGKPAGPRVVGTIAIPIYNCIITHSRESMNTLLSTSKKDFHLFVVFEK